jgi:hypothetical protein
VVVVVIANKVLMGGFVQVVLVEVEPHTLLQDLQHIMVVVAVLVGGEMNLLKQDAKVDLVVVGMVLTLKGGIMVQLIQVVVQVVMVDMAAMLTGETVDLV